MKTYPRWPLAVIALPAGVAVWSGWVSLGLMCGFGNVELLPGIATWHVDTAVTLPVGTEVYAAYALGAWLSPRTPERAKTFAKRSALASLGMGLLAQVSYHLLASHGVHVAPWPVTVLVSSVPVSMLFMGAMLAHLMHGDEASSETVSTAEPEAVDASETDTAVAEDSGGHDTEPATGATEVVALPDTTGDTATNAEPDTDTTSDTTPPRQAKSVSVSGLSSGKGKLPGATSDTERRARRLLKTTPDMSGAELARRLDLPNAKAGQRLKKKLQDVRPKLEAVG